MIVAVAELSPPPVASSFDAATVAVLVRVPQSAASVAPETCTEALAPSARSPKLHDRVPEAIEHALMSGVSDQFTPEGSGSLIVTLWAIPGPLFVAVIVNPAVSPAEIVP